MTLKSERFEVYNTVFKFMIEHNIHSVPVKAVEIANLIDAELIPLSTLAKQSGLSSEDIISVLGSHDGVTCAYHTQNKNVHKIIYNDKQSKERIRFTCLEECSHILLGHTEDPRFGIFSQSYEEMVYQKYEKLARIAAGLFLCPPQLYFKYKSNLSTGALMEMCDISEACAKVRKGTLLRFESEIKAHPLYSALPTINCKKDPNIQMRHLKPVWSHDGSFDGFQIVP